MINKDFQDYINQIIAALESNNNAAWIKPWSSQGFHNPVTGSVYSGMNILWLALYQMFSGDNECRFATFNQLKKAFGDKPFLKKGSKGIRLYYYNLIEKEKDGEKTSFPVLNSFVVFSFSQLNEDAHKFFNTKYPLEVSELILSEQSEKVEAILKAYMNRQNISFIEGGNVAAYVPSKDQIKMPQKDTFVSIEAYLSVLAHECAHSTGHSTRLNRVLNTDKHSLEYAVEEVKAELTANLLLAIFGLQYNAVNSMVYIVGWLKRVQDAPKVIFNTFSYIEKVVKYIIGESK